MYKNDGKGNFSIDTRAFPNNDMNIAVAVNYDYDGDGDEDLYVGSRSVPFNYGVTPQSYIYNNDGTGHFTDVTATVAKELQTAGMITAAVWTDIDNDKNKNKELVITGEWMSTRVWSYNKTKNVFEEKKQTGLENLSGWWQSIAATDVNGDGKQDLIIGNIGENFYLRPSAQQPVKLWLNDFDGNGSTEQFLTRTWEGRDVPVFLKREITDQFPGLKKENLKHAVYAKKSIGELFSKEVLSKSTQKIFNYCSSIVAINKGDGSFSITALPQMVQLTSLNAIAVRDMNGDNKPDLVTAGNLFTFPPQFGRLDGGYGNILINDGKGNYSVMDNRKTGISIKEEVKDIKWISGRNNKVWMLVLRNGERPVRYAVK